VTRPSTADLARARWCGRYGHTWPPRATARPGDEHWCDYCGACRTIDAQGRAHYVQEWST
jgi:hypothetical protein